MILDLGLCKQKSETQTMDPCSLGRPPVRSVKRFGNSRAPGQFFIWPELASGSQLLLDTWLQF